MGETKDPLQGTPQGTGNSSDARDGITSKDSETYTKESQDKAVQDALSAAGRDAKALTGRETAVKAREEATQAYEAKAAQAQKEKDEAEIEAVRHDPDKLSALQRRQAAKAKEDDLANREATLARSKAEHEDQLKALKQSEVTETANRLAKEHNVDPSLLVEFGGDTVDSMEKLAKKLAGKTGDKQPDPLHPDSSVTTGGGKDLSGKSPLTLAHDAYTENERKRKK